MGILGTLFPSYQTKLLKNEALREEMRDRKKRRGAMDQLGTLLGPSTAGPGIAATPEMMDRRMDGLLFQAAPEAVTEGLLAQRMGSQRTPADLQMMEALGFPKTAEGYAQYKAASQSPDARELLAQIQAQNLLDERAAAERDAAETEQAGRDRAFNAVKSGNKIADALDTLEGTFIEPGKAGASSRVPIYSLLAEGADLTGIGDAEGMKKALTAANSFNATANQFVIDTLNEIEGSTNAKMAVLQESKPRFDMNPDANRESMLSFIDRVEQEVTRQGVVLPENVREGFDNLRERLNPQADMRKLQSFIQDLPEDQQQFVIEQMSTMTPSERVQMFRELGLK